MRFPLSWPERLYGLVLMTYPRSFRTTYEHEMRTVFRELLDDPDYGSWRLTGLVLRDLATGIARPEHRPDADLTKQSTLFGLLVVLFYLAARAVHPGEDLGQSAVPIPFIAYIPAGFWGARRTGSFAGGMWVCMIMGAVSSTTVPLDWLLFHHGFSSAFELVMSMTLAVAFCVVPAAIGSIAGTASPSVRREAPLPPPPSTGGAR